VIWWVAYQRGSFNLKESYTSIQRAHERCLLLLAQAQYLRVISGDDIDGLASVAHCFELPPPKRP
jgi:hypothetical protein